MTQSIRDFWTQTMEIPEAQWVFWGTVLVVVILVAVYITMMFRNLAVGKDDHSADYLTEFRRMKDEGKLDEDEFASLKSAIPQKMPSATLELKTAAAAGIETKKIEDTATPDTLVSGQTATPNGPRDKPLKGRIEPTDSASDERGTPEYPES